VNGRTKERGRWECRRARRLRHHGTDPFALSSLNRGLLDIPIFYTNCPRRRCWMFPVVSATKAKADVGRTRSQEKGGEEGNRKQKMTLARVSGTAMLLFVSVSLLRLLLLACRCCGSDGGCRFAFGSVVRSRLLSRRRRLVVSRCSCRPLRNYCQRQRFQ